MHLTNALVVTDGTIREGTITIHEGAISACLSSTGRDEVVLDCEGDFLLPGLIDIHTDNVEHHVRPRPGVRWPSILAAVLAHDRQIVASGITTVLDALSFGDYDGGGERVAILDAVIEAISLAKHEALFHADHYLHFRCEMSDPIVRPLIDRHFGNADLRLVSMMDHTPGQRQYRDLSIFREFRRKKNSRIWTDAEFAVYLDEQRQRQSREVPLSKRTIIDFCKDARIPLASHDDTTLSDVDESLAAGVSISEFPTTLEAARRANELGMKVVMGAPNIVLGGSHSGNVAAADLANSGLLDGLTSDYVPGSLLHAAFALAAQGFDLAETIALVTQNPAALLGFTDRGRIAPGLRADLVRVRLVHGVPVIRNVWVAGRQYL
ncbi:alpha-D-ribose 1-methylphosphonate 5-triphosphate diphosphatase [Chelatococcus asaccharovorans]|uniref:Alpha-D-ribose 1-methylphosphonate 5-triphosphate diphosphatase n=1 Tax=Chelatococcus asaccharovorans TaxID=28210 RepID=A0A2V3U514_9HYPH|nr:alpha-D-ribose 1-methylphosphonate 5-triphosphate diphosphatase [Chelatococcus asaccharovorans]MBS7703053.1 alpha-D-ribose 1-methylphosphonate 5-triphosphate diphosphatase [Chelatococcus asaccharovorans]PXW57352.1 alpha-D-ribose 1-methylphosphonate 5-triphosphate diphosphatase [Chelatococcus asaccharovorans]